MFWGWFLMVVKKNVLKKWWWKVLIQNCVWLTCFWWGDGYWTTVNHPKSCWKSENLAYPSPTLDRSVTKNSDETWSLFFAEAGKSPRMNWKTPVLSNMVHLKNPRVIIFRFYVNLWGRGNGVSIKCVQLPPISLRFFVPSSLCVIVGWRGSSPHRLQPSHFRQEKWQYMRSVYRLNPNRSLPVVFAIDFSFKNMWKITDLQGEKSRGLRFPRRNKSPQKISKKMTLEN